MPSGEHRYTGLDSLFEISLAKPRRNHSTDTGNLLVLLMATIFRMGPTTSSRPPWVDEFDHPSTRLTPCGRLRIRLVIVVLKPPTCLIKQKRSAFGEVLYDAD